MKKAIGLIETVGLVPAIEAADAGVKAANVILLGFENTKGAGKITIKFAGDVGAVKAAVAAGVAAAERVGQVYGQHIIPRPHDEISALIQQVNRGQAKELLASDPEPLVAPSEAPEVDVQPEPEDKRCIAITKTGERCKLPARPGSKYCNFHRKLEQTD